MFKKLFFKSLLTVIVLLSAAGKAEGQTRETFPFVQRDSTLYLDVWHPANPRADRAAVVSVFGGGFVIGKRDDSLQSRTARMLSERGFTVISIDYRLGLKDSAKVAELQGLLKIDDLFQYCIGLAVEDCAAAIAWVCAHATELGINTSKIILTGNSAGAITVLQLDYSRANALSPAALLPDGWKPAAVIPYAGGVMCRKRDLKYAAPPAPTMLLHGVEDKIVAYSHFGLPFSAGMFGSNRISKQFRKQEIPHWIIRFKGIGHEVASWFPQSVELFCCFAEQTLSGRISWLDAVMTDSRLQPTVWTDMNMLRMYKGVR
jgi:alpha/beta superfamily hydrolase